MNESEERDYEKLVEDYNRLYEIFAEEHKALDRADFNAAQEREKMRNRFVLIFVVFAIILELVSAKNFKEREREVGHAAVSVFIEERMPDYLRENYSASELLDLCGYEFDDLFFDFSFENWLDDYIEVRLNDLEADGVIEFVE